MSALSITKQQVSTIHLALQDAGIEATATRDAEQAYSLLTDGHTVAMVQVSNTAFDTWTVSTHTVRYIIVAPTLDALAGWDMLDPLAEALKEPLELESAELSMWQALQGHPWPALICTTTISEIDE